MKAVCLMVWMLMGLSGCLSAQEDLPPLDQLVGRVVKIATPGSGVGREGQELSQWFQKHDPKKACEVLIPLLDHQKEGVADLASYMILDCDQGLVASQLPALERGFQNGGGWLPHAIASLGTEEATQFLVREFRKKPQVQGQVDSALARLAEKSVPCLLAEFEKADVVREAAFFAGVRFVFKRMKGKADVALPRLMEIACSESQPMGLRQQAVLTIGHVGAPAEPLFAKLRVLAKRQPEAFAEVFDEAVMASDTASTAALMVEAVNAGADHYTIRNLALLGARAKPHGPAVIKWLELPSWEGRVMAARTLGAIGYQDGRAALEKRLKSEDDWRLAYVAIKSLVDLNARQSIPALEKAARDHWFPVVRALALEAIGSLNDGGELPKYGGTRAANLSDYVFVDREPLTIDDGQLAGLGERKAGAVREWYFSGFKREYPGIAKEYLRLRNEGGGGLERGFGRVSTLSLDGGLLIGASAGEWVGGLQWAPENGAQRVLLQQNILGIEQWNGEVVVFSGMRHMGMNAGRAHRLVQCEGEWTLVPWFILPGCPEASWVTRTGQLVVNCHGGALVFTGLRDFDYHGAEAPGD